MTFQDVAHESVVETEPELPNPLDDVSFNSSYHNVNRDQGNILEVSSHNISHNSRQDEAFTYINLFP